MQRLRHPSVPKVFGHGDALRLRLDGRFGTDGAEAMPFVVMERLNGVSLARRLTNDGPMAWPEAVEHAAVIAEMLAVAHRRGIAHRDLTPVNVMLTSTGVKIIDFGLAKTIAGHHDSAQDVYALGVLLYQMLTGRSPYPAAARDFAFDGRVSRPAPTPVLACSFRVRCPS